MPDNSIPACPIYGKGNTYPDSDKFIYLYCWHEWLANTQASDIEEKRIHKDVHRNIWNDGDTVTLIKNPKVKGSSFVIKVIAKIKSILFKDEYHNVNCKVDGKSMLLKSKFMKKA